MSRKAIDAYIIDEDEARTIMSGDPVFGELPGKPPEPPDPMEGLDPMGLPKVGAPKKVATNGSK